VGYLNERIQIKKCSLFSLVDMTYHPFSPVDSQRNIPSSLYFESKSMEFHFQ
jgi:hypothetical protein